MKTFLVLLLLSKLALAQECSIYDKNSFINLLKIKQKINKNSQINLDSGLLLGWDQNGLNPCDPPFKVIFKKGNKTVTYLAVDHVSQPEEPTSLIFKSIESEIKTNKPQSVLIETVTNGVMPKAAYESILKNCYEGKKFKCGEAAYSALIANSIGSSVNGGEPILTKLNNEVLKEESVINLLAYRSTQVILNFKRQGLPENEWKKNFNDELLKNISFLNADWSYIKYTDWLNEKSKLKLNQINDNWIEPRNDSSASDLQKIAFHVDQSREPLILKEVEKIINNQDRIMIIYGSGHFYKERPVLEKAFGLPKIKCLK